MDTETLRSKIAAYVSCINARVASDIASLFAEDAIQADPASQPANEGRAAIEAFFTAGIEASEAWTFRASDLHPCGNAVAFSFAIDVVTGGATMTIAGIEIFTFDDSGLVRTAHAYWGDDDITFG